MELSRQLHVPTALPPEKDPRYPLDRRLGGPQSLSGRRGEDKILDPTETRTPDSSIVQLIASRCTDCGNTRAKQTYTS
jgi:hypothetical protein